VESGAETAPGVTKTSIKVGGVVTFTSANGFSEAGVDLGAKARFKRANDEGGVNGRKFDYVGSRDDGLNPSTALDLTRALVQDQKVFAVVPVGAPAFTSAGGYLVDQKVPFVGWGTTPPFCGNDYGFGVFGCGVALNPTDLVSNAQGAMLEKVLGGAPGKSVALVAGDSQAGKASLPASAAGMKAAGFRVVYSKANMPSTAVTDYSPYARDLMTADNGKPPDVISLVLQTPFVIGLRQALTAAGYKGVTVDGVTYDPKLLQNSQSKQALQGEYVSAPFEPFESNTSAVSQMTKDLKAVAGANFQQDQYMAYGYYMADLFIAMVKKAGPNLTRESLVAAANDNFSYEVKGGVGLNKFPDNHTAPAPCSALLQIDGDKFVTKVPLACYQTTPVGS
jgi:ABC-type branched-subunit amino acid transport system substrate-binding protein